MKASYKFYNKLITHTTSLRYLLKDERLFTAVPKFWHVIVTDIENSTLAIEKGYHNSVNLAATGSIIAVLNKIKQSNTGLKIPYFFGGDGVTFLVPADQLEECILVLRKYSEHVKKEMNLVLRVGSVKVDAIYKMNHQLKIAKIKLNPNLTVPIVLGHGLKIAEKRIKKENYELGEHQSLKKVSLNLKGMQCRWDEILPPKMEDKVMCLLINTVEEKNQIEVFDEVMEAITDSFGTLEERAPISKIRLKLDITYQKIRKEMYMRLGKYKLSYLISNWLLTNIGKYYFKFFEKGKKYLDSVVQLSDTLMVDGSINTIISGTQENIDRLINKLNTMEKNGKIRYGVHVTYASIMSCYVNDFKKNHIHFVDATEGGYTSAANVYKQKLHLA